MKQVNKQSNYYVKFYNILLMRPCCWAEIRYSNRSLQNVPSSLRHLYGH